ncbi:HAD family hydrolase [Maribacter aestuarii]|uniref:HAD family hydrolase n=1 Tax=Maribacter aestuarii TaxID=1130723 RepID=UPI00248AB05C|nr:HAD family hydrolase [Maribacter aestuarii]
MTAKNLILDLDNTLYGYDIPHKIALSTVLERFSAKFNISEELAQQSFDKGRQNTHLELPKRAASHNRLLYVQKMLEYNAINSMHYALEFYELYWGTFLKHMTLFEGVIDYLENCRAKGGKICILTDLTAHIQFRKIEKLGLAKYVDFLVTSEEVGIEKPDAAMFTKALQKLDCKASEALMIGDSWSKDIVGANAMGIPSFWINHKKEAQLLTENIREVSRFANILTDGK